MPAPERPTRLLIVAPSWIGDAAMATPALRILRDALPGALIGALARPGIDTILHGAGLIDDWHIGRAHGVMGPKRLAAALRPRRYDAAILLPNSFSAALITRLAWIPQRFGYDRDARALLLTHALDLPRRADTPPFDRDTARSKHRAPIPAVHAYATIANHALRAWGLPTTDDPGPLHLAVTDDDRDAADRILADAGLTDADLDRTGALLINPGANNPAKRWPAERFAAAADHAAATRGWIALITGSPAERDLTTAVARASAPSTRAVDLAAHGVTLGALKAIAARARAMLTNDTGPRHIAAALATPTITLFGPTDPRWTTIPAPNETELTADPTLEPHLVADDHPDRCAIDRITLPRVATAIDALPTA